MNFLSEKNSCYRSPWFIGYFLSKRLLIWMYRCQHDSLNDYCDVNLKLAVGFAETL